METLEECWKQAVAECPLTKALVNEGVVDDTEMPAMAEAGCTFLQAVETVEKLGKGFVFYTDADGRLTGISSNADIRRAVLKHRENIHDVPADDFINRRPLTVHRDENITGLLRMVKKQAFPVNFLPVTDDGGKLVGYLTFNALIRGES